MPEPLHGCTSVLKLSEFIIFVPFFFYHDQHQPVNFFAKERLGFSLIVNMTHFFFFKLFSLGLPVYMQGRLASPMTSNLSVPY